MNHNGTHRAIAAAVVAFAVAEKAKGLDEVEVTRPIRRAGPVVGRNDPCPCGSGRKFKVCCNGRKA